MKAIIGSGKQRLRWCRGLAIQPLQGLYKHAVQSAKPNQFHYVSLLKEWLCRIDGLLGFRQVYRSLVVQSGLQRPALTTRWAMVQHDVDGVVAERKPSLALFFFTTVMGNLKGVPLHIAFALTAGVRPSSSIPLQAAGGTTVFHLCADSTRLAFHLHCRRPRRQCVATGPVHAPQAAPRHRWP